MSLHSYRSHRFWAPWLALLLAVVAAPFLGLGASGAAGPVSAQVPASDAAGNIVPGIESGSLKVIKSGVLTPDGQKVEWTTTAENTSTVTLTRVTLGDQRADYKQSVTDWPGPTGRLSPGQIVIEQGTSPVEQYLRDAGQVVNRMKVEGRSPDGALVLGEGSATVPIPQNPDVTFTKSGVRVADTVTWTFTVHNSGDVTLTAPEVVDTLSGLSEITWVDGTPARLAPGATATATASSSLTSALRDAGEVTNDATLSVTAPKGTLTRTATATVPIVQGPHVTLHKSGTLVGNHVEWTVLATNSGDVTLHDVAITDQLAGLQDVQTEWPGTDGLLAAGGTATWTATSPVTQAMRDAGVLHNEASVTAVGPKGQDVSADDQTDVQLPQNADVTFTKRGQRQGQSVLWTLTVTNTGNVTVSDVAVADRLAGLGALSWSGLASGSLAPGATATATASSPVTQQLLDAGSVTNEATLEVTPAGATAPLTRAAEDTVTLVDSSAPTMAMALRGTVTGNTVTFHYTVTNTGPVGLEAVTVASDLKGLPLPALSPQPLKRARVHARMAGPSITLAAGQSATGTTTHRVTAAEKEAGRVVARFTTRGTSGAGVAASSAARVTVKLPTKASEPTPSDQPGDGSDKPGTPNREDTGGTLLPNTGTRVTLAGVGAGLLLILLGALIVRRRRGESAKG